MKPLELEAAINAYTRRVTVELEANRNPDPAEYAEDLATLVKRSVLLGMKLGGDLTIGVQGLFQRSVPRKTDVRFWPYSSPEPVNNAPVTPVAPPAVAPPASVVAMPPVVPQEPAELAPSPVADVLQIAAHAAHDDAQDETREYEPLVVDDAAQVDGQQGAVHLTRSQRRAAKEARRAEQRAQRNARAPVTTPATAPEVAP